MSNAGVAVIEYCSLIADIFLFLCSIGSYNVIG